MGDGGWGKDTDVALDVLADMVLNRFVENVVLLLKMNVLHRGRSYMLEEKIKCNGYGFALHTPLCV